ncbi:unnamed protein product [Cylicostephanus goldi]|uniref:Uncharacterized protein n=1 Tax=Cylicostephanus goldi TaxID=71465 RepID=A0A3P6SQ21_CYLGO|nr:unnamed protein product [Cylicostephanus goldi]
MEVPLFSLFQPRMPMFLRIIQSSIAMSRVSIPLG